MTGGSHFAEVFLDEVRIPAANVLGEVDAGWGVAMTTLLNERVFIGGNVRRFTTDDLVTLARTHDRHKHPTTRQGLADAYIRAEILTYLGYRVRTAVGRGEEPGPEASCMKLSMARHLRESFDLALAIQGAAGTIDGDRWHQQFLNAPSIRIAGGSDEIQRNVIGERALGLPGDVRVDKGIPFNQIPTSPTNEGRGVRKGRPATEPEAAPGPSMNTKSGVA
jgi:alkylation response protein AidB-like acyl-CoA dehydrogenase